MFPNPEVFGLLLDWYSLWQWLAIIITLSFGLWYYKYKITEKITLPKLALLVISFLFVGYLGARVFSVLFQFTETGTWLNISVLWQNIGAGRLRWYGVLLFMILLMPYIAKVFKIREFRTYLDAMALNLCLFCSIVKQACLFSGDGCYGVYTNSVFGMYFPYGYVPNILPVHPTPLYDSLFHLTFFIFLLWWNGRKKFNGQTAIIFFAGTSIFNIALEFIRINPKIMLGLTFAQLTYFLIIIITLIYYFGLRKKSIQKVHALSFS